MVRIDRLTWLIPWLLLGTVLLGACAEPTLPPLPPPSPTVSAERVSAQPTSPGERTAPAPTATLALPSTEEPQPASTPTAEVGPLPALLRRITLAPADASLEDLLVDRAGGRLYVTDTAGRLHILDLGSYHEVATLAATGYLTLDGEHGRLYVAPLVAEGAITVVDTTSMSVAGTIAPGGRVALDGGRNRIYVGNRISFMPEAGTPGVRVYDGATLEKLGEIAQPGIPAYNPLRDELTIVGYTVYLADPETLKVTGDLLPEILAQPLAWCNGCTAATDAYVYPDRNLLLVEVTTLSAGKGPGILPPPRFFDATTLDELTGMATLPAVESACGKRPILAAPVEGCIYRGEEYSRYMFYNNLLVQAPGGELLTWRDGLPLGITNPRTGQMYLPHGADTLVIDLGTLTPVGSLPPACIHTLEADTGRIYALWERDLLVFAETGGWAAAEPAGQAGSLPAEQVTAVYPSPDYARDQTLFLVASGKLYRSTDAGQSWARLYGGLPVGDYLTLDLALSPAFAVDRTLFAGGFRGDFWGEGVYRSIDGGDSWQPAWRDLTHLRVYDVAVSPGYGTDGTVVAYSRYQRLVPWESGLSIFRSEDQGLTWTLVMTQPQGATLPPPKDLLSPGPLPPAVRFRVGDYGTAVERTVDGGQSWEPLVVTREPQFWVQAILASPGFAGDRTVYVLADSLFRSTDQGDTWARWRDERLIGRDYSQKLTTLAASPLLPDGRHQLFIGTAAGEFWSLDPAALTWEPVKVAEPWPTVLAGEWVNEIETSPAGDAWLGTWGYGLARYADGAIQARYTVTDGLPSQYIGGIAVATDGKLWVAGDLSAGVTSFDGQTWTPHPFAADHPVDSLFDVTAGADGSIWVAGQAVGLRHWTGSKWETIADPGGATDYRTNEVELDAGGTLWCATADGLAYYRNGQWSSQPTGEIEAIEFSPGGVAYAMMSGGTVWRTTGEQWTQLPPVKEGQFLNGLVLHAAGDGAVWLGSYDGAYRFDGQTWQHLTAQDGLPANQVAAIAEDADGWLWFGTEKGAARVDPATLSLSTPTWPVPAAPTPTPAAPTPTPRLTPTPAPCAQAPAPAFAAAYAEKVVASRLGCPAGEVTVIYAAFEPFEQGLMLWRQDWRQIYALQAEGTWASYADTWEDSQLPSDATLTPPAGLQQPVRGFGKVWREQLGGPQAAIGWALAAEQPFDMVTQAFRNGLMIRGAGGEVHILYSDMTWEMRAQP